MSRGFSVIIFDNEFDDGLEGVEFVVTHLVLSGPFEFVLVYNGLGNTVYLEFAEVG
jgi:hypothetical protein